MENTITNQDIRVVSVCDQVPEAGYYCYNEFMLSLQIQGVTPLILGKKKGEYNGLASKPKLLLKAIKLGWITEKYIIFCDSFDLVFTAPITYIVEKFYDYNCDIVIGAEKNCFPNTYKNNFDKFWSEKNSTPYKYVNSGFLVGKTESFRVLLERMDLENEPDDHMQEDGTFYHSNDQELFQKAWVNQLVKISMDTHCILNWCMMNVDSDEIGKATNMIQCLETGNYPATIHWNGGAKTNGTMDGVLKHLRLRP